MGTLGGLQTPLNTQGAKRNAVEKTDHRVGTCANMCAIRQASGGDQVNKVSAFDEACHCCLCYCLNDSSILKYQTTEILILREFELCQPCLSVLCLSIPSIDKWSLY